MEANMLLPCLGAGGFGAIIGWFVYYINRYRKSDVQFSDLTTMVGVIGGASITSLFGPGKEALFGAYGVGLFAGFFGYFFVLLILVAVSKGVFTWTWFLDGRRKKLATDEEIQGDTRATVAPMSKIPLITERVASLEERVRTLGVAPQAATLQALAQAPVDPTAAKIISICDAKQDANKGDSSAYVIAVANQLEVLGLKQPADSIVDAISSAAGWSKLDDGVAAKEAANKGLFVIGGLKGADHAPPRVRGCTP